MTSLQLLALGLVCEGLMLSTAFATTMTSVYDSTGDLDLDGIFHSAVNFSGTTGVDVVINDATFSPIPLTLGGTTSPVGPIDNVTLRSLNGRVRNPGGTVSPTFPAGNADLETISGTVALSDGAPSGTGFTPSTMGINVGALTQSQPYKLQLLFFDVFQNFLGPSTSFNRLFDIKIEGVTEISNFDIVALTGSGGTAGAFVTHLFTGPADGDLEIQLIPRNFPPNFSPLISALNVETVPEPGTILLLGTGLAGLVAWRMRKGRA